MNYRRSAPGLEYLLLFGLPENKTEIIDGRMRTVWPFQSLEDAENAFHVWCAQIERWRGVSPEIVREAAQVQFGGITVERLCRVVEVQIPIFVDGFLALFSAFWRRELWDLAPDDTLPGTDHPFRCGDIRMNLWRAFDPIEERGTRWRCCSGDVMLTSDTNLYLDFYCFSEEAPMQLIGGDFAAGVPLFAAQILAPFSREVDRGPRLALMHRAGVRNVWLLDPALETIDILAWEASGYSLQVSYRPGDVIRPGFAPDLSISVTELFRDQFGKDLKQRRASREAQGTGGETRAGGKLGLEHLLLLGHPGRRHEIWRDHSPCVLAFGSPDEARDRFRDFLVDAGHWTGTVAPAALQLSDDVETARVGQFMLSRNRNRVHMDVKVDHGIYLRMLEALADSDIWDEYDQSYDEQSSEETAHPND